MFSTENPLWDSSRASWPSSTVINSDLIVFSARRCGKTEQHFSHLVERNTALD